MNCFIIAFLFYDSIKGRILEGTAGDQLTPGYNIPNCRYIEQSHTLGQYRNARSVQRVDHSSTLTVRPAEYSNIIERISMFDHMIDLAN